MKKNGILLLLLLSLLSVVCNPAKPEDTCSPIDDPQATNDIQILYPAAGDTLKIGTETAIEVKFKKNQVMNDHLGAGAQLVINEKKVYDIVTNGEYTIPSAGTYTCGEIPWTVGNEGLILDKDSVVSATIKVWHYQWDADYYFNTKTFYIRK